MELQPADIQALHDAASRSEFPERDLALVHASLYWGFTASELSRLQLQTVMQRNGEWRERFKLRPEYAFNGESRTAWLLDAGLKRRLDDWASYRLEHHWGEGRGESFRGLDERQPLFLNNRGQAFAMTPRSAGSEDLLPTAMNRLLRELLDAAGLEEHSPLDLRDTYILRLWDAGLAKQDIMTLTGIRRSETINRKVRDRIPAVEDVFAGFHGELFGEGH